MFYYEAIYLKRMSGRQINNPIDLELSNVSFYSYKILLRKEKIKIYK